MQLAHTVPTARTVPAVITIALHLIIVYVFAMSLGVVPKIKVLKDTTLIDIPAVQRPPDTKTHRVNPQALNSHRDLRDAIKLPDMPDIENSDDSGIKGIVADSGTDSVTAPTLAEPKTLHSFEPPYPNLSRLRGEEGLVVVRVTILPSGAIGDSAIETSSGFHRLDAAALKAVREFRFSPAMRGTQAILGSKLVAVRFRLRE